jgi:hypothetical protein
MIKHFLSILKNYYSQLYNYEKNNLSFCLNDDDVTVHNCTDCHREYS